MGIEIERRFLVKTIPPLDGVPVVEVEQGYLCFGKDGSEVRVRRAGSRLTLTLKRGGGLSRQETEIELSPEQFEILWPETSKWRLLKSRYSLALGEHTVEIDVYSGMLRGLVVAEAEFSSEAASATFSPPAWCGREITEDDRFRNRAIVALDANSFQALLNEVRD